MDDHVQDSIPTAGSATDADPKWREASVNWARRAPENEVERLVGNRSDPRDGVELRIRRTDQPSLFTELSAELHCMGDEPDQSLRVEPWCRAFVDGATSVWGETTTEPTTLSTRGEQASSRARVSCGLWSTQETTPTCRPI